MTDETEPKTTAEIVAEAIEVISPAPLDDGMPKRRKKAEEAPVVVKQKYMVINGAIAPFGGGRSDLVQPGSVVELTVEQAKHYNALGYLKPHIED